MYIQTIDWRILQRVRVAIAISVFLPVSSLLGASARPIDADRHRAAAITLFSNAASTAKRTPLISFAQTFVQEGGFFEERARIALGITEPSQARIASILHRLESLRTPDSPADAPASSLDVTAVHPFLAAALIALAYAPPSSDGTHATARCVDWLSADTEARITAQIVYMLLSRSLSDTCTKETLLNDTATELGDTAAAFRLRHIPIARWSDYPEATSLFRQLERCLLVWWKSKTFHEANTLARKQLADSSLRRFALCLCATSYGLKALPPEYIWRAANDRTVSELSHDLLDLARSGILLAVPAPPALEPRQRDTVTVITKQNSPTLRQKELPRVAQSATLVPTPTPFAHVTTPVSPVSPVAPRKRKTQRKNEPLPDLTIPGLEAFDPFLEFPAATDDGSDTHE